MPFASPQGPYIGDLHFSSTEEKSCQLLVEIVASILPPSSGRLWLFHTIMRSEFRYSLCLTVVWYGDYLNDACTLFTRVRASLYTNIIAIGCGFMVSNHSVFLWDTNNTNFCLYIRQPWIARICMLLLVSLSATCSLWFRECFAVAILLVFNHWAY